MNCKQCGSHINRDDGEKFCPFCGVKLNEPVSLPALEEYSVEQKVKFFNDIYNMASNQVGEFALTGNDDNDDTHYLWEAVMMGLFGKDFFKDIWNKLHH